MLSIIVRAGKGRIERGTILIDQPSKNVAAMLHMPDVRLTDIETRILRGSESFPMEGEAPDRAMLFYPLAGDFKLEFPGFDEPPILISQGTAVGLQVGRRHRWTPTGGHPKPVLMASSILRKAALLQGLDHETIIVPPDAEPSATIIRHAVAIHQTEHETRANSGDDMIIRRASEIVMAEFVRFARTSVVGSGDIHEGIARDEYLLRAWSAYYAAPRRRWTVKALGQAAGLGRSAFSDRFGEAVGVPPLTAITDLRMAHAVTLLLEDAMPLIEIAFTVGYTSEAAFVRAFARKYGMPPGQYRRSRVAS